MFKNKKKFFAVSLCAVFAQFGLGAPASARDDVGGHTVENPIAVVLENHDDAYLKAVEQHTYNLLDEKWLLSQEIGPTDVDALVTGTWTEEKRDTLEILINKELKKTNLDVDVLLFMMPGNKKVYSVKNKIYSERFPQLSQDVNGDGFRDYILTSRRQAVAFRRTNPDGTKVSMGFGFYDEISFFEQEKDRLAVNKWPLMNKSYLMSTVALHEAIHLLGTDEFPSVSAVEYLSDPLKYMATRLSGEIDADIASTLFLIAHTSDRDHLRQEVENLRDYRAYVALSTMVAGENDATRMVLINDHTTTVGLDYVLENWDQLVADIDNQSRNDEFLLTDAIDKAAEFMQQQGVIDVSVTENLDSFHRANVDAYNYIFYNIPFSNLETDNPGWARTVSAYFSAHKKATGMEHAQAPKFYEFINRQNRYVSRRVPYSTPG